MKNIALTFHRIMVRATKTSLNLQEDFLSLAAIQAGVKCIDVYQIKDDLIGSSVSDTCWFYNGSTPGGFGIATIIGE